MTDILFTPYSLNATLQLPNRIVMAPMTRNMADADFVPTLAMAEYYAKRAQAGLIITEGTIIRLDGRGYSNVPGIYTPAQIAGWRRVTDKVHAKGGRIFCQIWHVGRVTHPDFINGAEPLSASRTQLTGALKRASHLNYVPARAVSKDEMLDLVESYAEAAKNAILAGFDGVELHGANGYLLDQFLHYDTNHRHDEYGGNAENMARFPLAVVKACGQLIGFERVGIRLSPGGYLHDIKSDPRDKAVFEYLLTQFNPLHLAYVHTGNFHDDVRYPSLDNETMTAFLRKSYQGTLIACGGYDIESASDAISHHQFDLIAFGKPFIANSDLLIKIKNRTPLVPYDVAMLATLN